MTDSAVSICQIHLVVSVSGYVWVGLLPRHLEMELIVDMNPKDFIGRCVSCS